MHVQLPPSLSISMARLLLLLQTQASWPAATRSVSNNTTLLLLFLASVAAVASVIAALCTTHKHRGVQNEVEGRAPSTSPGPKEERSLVSALSSISSKAMQVTKMVSWKKAPEEAEASGPDGALWKKSIIMGEKCRPWNFSGQISYDAMGRRLPENKNKD